jgi:hypothetical protein
MRWVKMKTFYKTLVVGQDVDLSCGDYRCKGEVVKVTPEGVEVRTASKELLQFDNNGRGYPAEDTYECTGPWYIDDGPEQIPRNVHR